MLKLLGTVVPIPFEQSGTSKYTRQNVPVKPFTLICQTPHSSAGAIEHF